MFIAATNDIFVHQPFNFADAVKVLSAYPGKSNGIFRAKPLQRFFADFQKSANLVTVHPAVFRLFFRFALYCGNEFGNRIYF
jgi:hypothetical protein